MQQKILYLFTRTPLHVGAGSSVGAIDQPIQRERHTGFPIIPGSSMKGVLRGLFSQDQQQEALFGPDVKAKEHFAGSLLIGEARCLCFPVRSAKNAFVWVTCPMVLRRYARDCGKSVEINDITEESCFASENVCINNNVILEEYCFTAQTPVTAGIIDLLKTVLPNEDLWKSLADRLVVLADGSFSDFCASACEVQQRIKIDDETGTVAEGALFNQENIPSETLFYALIGENKNGALEKLCSKLNDANVIQLGGDETVGLGFCSCSVSEGIVAGC